MKDLQLRKIVSCELSHVSGARTVFDCLFWVHMGALEKHDVLLRCGWFLCLKTTIQRTSSRLFRCVMFDCAPMPFYLQPFASFVALIVPWQVGYVNGSPFWIPVDGSFKKTYVEDWVFQVTDTSDSTLPGGQGDIIPETPRGTLPVPSSQREAPKPEVSTCAQERIEAPLPPLQPRSTCERWELPFSCDAILSGFEDLHLPRSDQFTMRGHNDS